MNDVDEKREQLGTYTRILRSKLEPLMVRLGRISDNILGTGTPSIDSNIKKS